MASHPPLQQDHNYPSTSGVSLDTSKDREAIISGDTSYSYGPGHSNAESHNGATSGQLPNETSAYIEHNQLQQHSMDISYITNDDVTFPGPLMSTTPLQDGQQAFEQDLEIEEDFDDADSAIGSEGTSYTTSMTESIYEYRKEHGRTYHAYKDGKYIFPNDDRESDRLDLQHHLFNITFDNKLFFAPLHLLPNQQPRHCLDIGTGTGIWAMDFADQFPFCQVTGTDLSPTQPSFVPPNCTFLIDDAEDDWAFHHKFDYIHGRLLAGCLADWAAFFRQAYNNLEPGGWLEMQDYGLPVRSFDGTHRNTNIHLWGELLCAASQKLGRPMGSEACDQYAALMREAGFVDVQELTCMWPSNSWPKDPKMKEIGKWNQINCMEGLEGFCLALLTRGLGWEKIEVDVFVAKVKRDFMDRKIHAYFPMPVVFGRKPFNY